jgi:hypothetical protein
VLCKWGGGERGAGSGREELGWVEEEKEKVPKPDREGRHLESSASRKLTTQ